MDITTDTNIENIIFLIGDAVRYDYTHTELADLGATYKTVASSLHTPTAFATMLTGRYSDHHGVHGFRQQVPDCLFSVFEIGDMNTVFAPGYANEWPCNQQELFGRRQQIPLSEVESPFIYINRHPGGHAPYDGFGEYGDKSVSQYYENNINDINKIRSDYEDAMDTFYEDIAATRQILRDREIEEKTLLIVTSDHGELLGEYGQLGHSFPAVPEIVYVPTTFIHPNIPSGEMYERVARHIDLVPSVLEYLNYNIDGGLPGVPLQNEGTQSYGICEYNRSFSDYIRTGIKPNLPQGINILDWLPEIRLTLESVWDGNGGVQFNRSNAIESYIILFLAIVGPPEGIYIRKKQTYNQARIELTSSTRTYGSPSFSVEEAEDLLGDFRQDTDLTNRVQSIDNETADQLKDMGYL